MIDDHFKNLDYFGGQTLLFTAHHNVFAPVGRHTWVNNWQEIDPSVYFGFGFRISVVILPKSKIRYPSVFA